MSHWDNHHAMSLAGWWLVADIGHYDKPLAIIEDENQAKVWGAKWARWNRGRVSVTQLGADTGLLRTEEI